MTATERGRLLAWANQPQDAAGLAAFRALFGALLAIASVRFLLKGWVAELYLQPTYHFTYWGFDWVKPWPAPFMYAWYAAMIVTAAGIALGRHTRSCALLFAGLFTYAELIDKTTYLNHYYLISLLALLLAIVPAGATWSLDAKRRRHDSNVPRWCYTLLRVQVGIVYFYAGFAKLHPDWLLRGEPLHTWLSGYGELPLVGALLASRGLAVFMSWCGAVYDLFVFAALSWRRTRGVAFCLVVAFHGLIWLLFPVGVFSWVMIVAATVFFDPSWPRSLLARASVRWPALERVPQYATAGTASETTRLRTPAALVLALYVAVQALLPLRFLFYPGDTNWTEEGFRFAWRVMLIEKTGTVEYHVVTDRGRFTVHPSRELTPLQYRMMSTQPDMIHDYARALRRRYEVLGHHNVAVYARAYAALNGRPSQLLVDPKRDLGSAPRSLAASDWIVPLAGP